MSFNYQRLYDYRFQGVDQTKRQAVWNEIAGFLDRKLGFPKRVLDPAAGRCEFINAVSAAERWVVDSVDYAQAYRDPRVKFVQASALDAELPEAHFDLIFVSNFLEHLTTQEQIASFIVRSSQWLRPGGHWVALGPNFKYCASEYFDCADHTLALTHVSVAEHFVSAGLELVQVVPRFLPYSFRGGLPASGFLAKLYLKMPWVWRFFGKQFLVVGKKGA
jgi:hypothetical protein